MFFLFSWIKKLADEMRGLAPYATLLSFVLACWSFYFARQATKEGAKTTRETVAMIASMKDNTDEISSNMKAISDATTAFKSSLQEIRAVMKEQAKSFETSITTLQTSIGSFNSSLQRQENVINSLAAATEKSVNVLHQRTELLEKELSRSPKLNLVARKVVRDTSGVINVDVWMVNSGNIFSSKQTILLRVPKDYRLASSGYRLSTPEEQEQVWSLQVDRFVGYDKSGQPSMMMNYPDMNFKLSVSSNTKNLKIPYKVFHEGGITEDSLTINVPK